MERTTRFLADLLPTAEMIERVADECGLAHGTAFKMVRQGLAVGRKSGEDFARAVTKVSGVAVTAEEVMYGRWELPDEDRREVDMLLARARVGFEDAAAHRRMRERGEQAAPAAEGGAT